MYRINASSIDVVIPVYDGEKYIIEAIRSVEEQTFKPSKIIVVDDGSTDKTDILVKNYLKTLTVPLEYIKKINEGPNSARNTGLKKCTSRYVAFLDADDVWRKNKLEEQLKTFKKNKFKNLGVVYCRYSLIDENSNPKNNCFVVEPDPKMRGNIFEKLLKANRITGSASGVLIKKDCFEKTGYFDESLRIGEDWDMWLRLAKNFDFDFSNKVLVKIRRHPDNAQGKPFYVFSHELDFYNKWANKISSISHPIRFLKWGAFISNKIVNRFPRRDFLKIAQKKLDRGTKKKIFLLAFGSLKLQLVFTLFINFFIFLAHLLVDFIIFPFRILKYFLIELSLLLRKINLSLFTK